MANERAFFMHTQWKIGDRLIHPEHGAADVRFVGNDYIGLRFSDDWEALVRLDAAPLTLWSEAAEAEWRAGRAVTEAPDRIPVPWPDSTFVFEAPNAEETHFLGSHWEPWYENGIADLIPRLPELLENAVLSEPRPVTRDTLHGVPENWTQGIYLAWPDAQRGILLDIAIDRTTGTNHFVGAAPFDTQGTRHTLEIDKVLVWQSGIEAQIAAWAGEARFAFFDTHFLHARGEYECGRKLEFSLIGLAYAARSSTLFELPFTPNPDDVAWQKQLAEEHGELWEAMPERLMFDGMAMFIPVDGWDIDDYQFRGPVKAVEPFDDFLGQTGWRVRVTVMRLSEYVHEDFDIDLLVTRRAWEGDTPPRLGQDIEDALWLQGRLLDPDETEA